MFLDEGGIGVIAVLLAGAGTAVYFALERRRFARLYPVESPNSANK